MKKVPTHARRVTGGVTVERTSWSYKPIVSRQGLESMELTLKLTCAIVWRNASCSSGYTAQVTSVNWRWKQFGGQIQHVGGLVSFRLIRYVRPLFLLPPSRISSPGSHRRLFSPLPTTVRALHVYRERTSDLLSSSTRVELCRPTVGALNSRSLFCFCKQRSNITTVGFEPQDQYYQHSTVTT